MAAWFVRRVVPRGEPDGVAVAFLVGGRRTAVWASIASLGSMGAVVVGADGQLTFPGPTPEPDTVPFAVFTALRDGPARPAVLARAPGGAARVSRHGRLAAEPEVAAAVDRLRQQLVADGWLGNRSATRRLLGRLRNAHRHLGPQSNPAWPVYGPHGAAVAVALFGQNAIWQADPQLARALGLPLPVMKHRQRSTPPVDQDADCGCS
ncbi:hypothetical protein [Plantactinospora endophytica]|uniref:Uncharacterized protein n=1 Tax=Plantactinospora endophytica TaxID=673535 RepID=A0ABQ4EBS9_9ACTN|nr:hypothetical protein [Plantactinospora endophytica]GIG92173.1 hypothetical protein Pen02_71090 [Plantactinospora endophytica]